MHKSYSDLKRENALIRQDIDQFMITRDIAAKPDEDTRERLSTILACFEGIEEGSAEWEESNRRWRMQAKFYLRMWIISNTIFGLTWAIFFFIHWR